jgi:hypothetical protein
METPKRVDDSLWGRSWSSCENQIFRLSKVYKRRHRVTWRRTPRQEANQKIGMGGWEKTKYLTLRCVSPKRSTTTTHHLRVNALVDLKLVRGFCKLSQFFFHEYQTIRVLPRHLMSTKIHSSPRNSRSGTLSHDRAILEVPLSGHNRVGLQNVS